MKLTFLNKVLNKEKVIEDFPKTAKKIYPKEVEEIHHEFQTASDKLLVQANEIIKEAESKDVNKVNRLQSLGFTNVQQVTEIKPIIEKSQLSKEQIRLIQDYKVRYPNNKFITEEQVREICHKYNLVCGDVSIFKGFVPEKNLRDIENFKLQSDEKNLMIIEAFKSSKSIGYYSAENMKIEFKHGYWCIYNNKNKYSFQQGSASLVSKGEFYGTDDEDFFGLKKEGHVTVRIVNKNLKICAPVKDMDITNLRLKDGYKLERHVPDPVVLQPVKGGYLIITAWGDEASDPLVVNETNN